MIAIPGYQSVRRIYEGANSFVLRAVRQHDRLPVVLKVLKRDYPTHREFTKFCHEYEIIKNHLDFDGVCRALELTQHDNSPVIVLEDFGGDALSMQIPPSGMSVSRALDLAISLVGNLGEIHLRNVIHRDINPSNIVYSSQSQIAKFIDFGISSVLTVESTTLGHPLVIEGTLAYISPEQTGRTNRAIDYRCDYYSLGVTLFELLTGQRPFSVTDSAELIACHIARQPPAPGEIRSDLPAVLSDLVMRLLAKNAEDRYQSSHGLLADLLRIRDGLRSGGTLESFQLSQNDVTGRFRLPQKLYGREQEIDELLSACERVGQGGRELVLVAGPSGIGKSVVIKELYRPLTELDGYFVGGKYEQYQRNTPYSALVSALDSLVQHLLAEPEHKLQQWRSELLSTLAGLGRVLTDVIPKLTLVIGEQPAVAPLAPGAALHRFNRLLQRFVRAFCRRSRPLVLFLDDLQWADAASLQFIEIMLLDEQTSNLLLVGAYRDNEVGAHHPLTTALEMLQREGAVVSWIRLSTLQREHLQRMLAETLQATEQEVASLAELVWNKTLGNPFFVNQFLDTLHNQQLVVFDPGDQRWKWDTEKVQAQGITDNVIELMVGKLSALPDTSQTVLQLAACLGHRFELGTLSTILGASAAGCASALRDPLEAGLIVPTSRLESLEQNDIEATLVFRNYRFLHDRVQQAAYATIPEAERAGVHLQIGRLFLSNWPPRLVEDRVFDVVNQLNHSVELIDEGQEREKLARLNLLAGNKALQAAAFESGYDYFIRGIRLLPPSCWADQYRLAVDLYTGAVEAAALNLDYDGLENIAEVALAQIQNILDTVEIQYYRGHYYVSQVKLQEAAESALRTLADLGEELPFRPSDADFEQAFARVNKLIDQVGFDSLLALQAMTDSKKSAAMMLVRSCMTPAFFGVPELLGVVICRFVELTLKHGQHPLSAYGFCTFSCLLNAGVGDIDRGKQFAELGYEMFRRQGDQRSKAAVYCFYWGLSRHFYKPIRESIEPLMEGYHSVLENGDNEHGLYCLINAFYSAILSGHNLAEIEQQFEKPIRHAVKFKQNQVLDQLYIWRQVVENFRGQADNPAVLRGRFFDAEGRLPELLSASEVLTAVYVGMCATMVYYHFGEHELALAHAERMEPNFGRSGGKYFYSDYAMYHSLAMTALYPSVSANDQRRFLDKVLQNQAKLKKWASYCEENFQHKYLLVEAELARIQNRDAAIDLFDQAVDSARRAEHIHNAALAAELAGRYWETEGRHRFAKVYLTEAYHGYQLWGADGKARYLLKQHPRLIMQRHAEDSAGETTTVTDTMSTRLDLVTVLKAAQALSGEIVLERLLTTLMQGAIENAGAQRGLLFLHRDGELLLEAESAIGWEQANVLQSLPLGTLDGPQSPLCMRIAEYVARTRDPVVLADASSDARFAQDEYVVRHQPRSVLCMPILNKGDYAGLLYLESNIAKGVFTHERLELLRLLSSQMAISIENSRLYSHLEERVAERSRQLQEAHQRIMALEKETIEKQMAGGFAHEIRNALSGAELVLSKALGYGHRVDDESISRENATALHDLRQRLQELLPEANFREVVSVLDLVGRNRKRMDGILELAHRATDRGLLITRKVLEYSKIGEEHAGDELLDLNEIVRSVASATEPDLIDKAIELHLELAEEPVQLFGNEVHFHSAIGILVGNARDGVASASNHETPGKIQVLVESTATEYLVRVIDNGEGIPPDDLKKVFEPFFSTRPDSGLGLGLGFALKIASLYGGSLDLQSEPGVETVATITLPLESPGPSTSQQLLHSTLTSGGK